MSSENNNGAKTVSEIIDSIGFGMYQIRLVLICGLLQTADAMEMLLLSVLGPILKCQWSLAESQVAMLTTTVFIGMGVGAPLFGFLSDQFGRRGILIVSAFFTFYFGCMSGFSPYLSWVLITRCLVGCGIGGMMSTISTLSTELTPTSMRSRCLTLILVFWVVGALFECLLAYLTIDSLGWQWLCVFSALPVMLAIGTMVVVPESPQFLLLQGSTGKVREILNSIAKVNKKPIYEGPIKAQTVVEYRGNVLNMFHGNYLETTVLASFIWFSCGLSYYGNVLLSTTLPTTAYHCLQNRSQMSDNINITTQDRSCCMPLTDETYITMTVTTLGEIGSFPTIILLSELLGRRWSMGICSLITGITFFSLDFCMGNVLRQILLMINRTVSNAAFITAYVYTSEVFPTSIRSVSLGVCSAMSRIGAIVTPFIAQVLLPNTSVAGALIIYSGIALVGAMASAMLPIETRGRLLTSSVHEKGKQQPTEKSEKLLSEKSNTANDYDTFK